MRTTDLNHDIQVFRLSLFAAQSSIVDDLVVAGRKTKDHLAEARSALVNILSHFREKYFPEAELEPGTRAAEILSVLKYMIAGIDQATLHLDGDLHLVADQYLEVVDATYDLWAKHLSEG